MEEDTAGFIWAGTSKGLFRYDGYLWKSIPLADSGLIAHITALAVLSDGQLWAGGKDGSLWRLANKKLHRFSPEEGLPEVSITGIASDGQGVLWFSTYGEGLYFYQNNRLYSFDTDDGLADNDIYTLETGPSGRIWAGSDRGVSICEVNNGIKKASILNRENGLPDNIVRSLAQDKNGHIWIGMYEGGICRYAPETDSIFVPYSAEKWPLGEVTTLLSVHDEVWIGTSRQGIWALEGTFLFPLVPGKRSKVACLMRDHQGNVWAAGKPFGLVSAQASFAYIPDIQENVKALAIGRRGRLWYSTPSGLYTYYPETGIFESHPTFSSLNIISLYEDMLGYLWIGTFGKGVYRMAPDKGLYETYDEASGLVNGNVLSIKGDSTNVWFATLGGVASCELVEDWEIVFENFDHTDGLGANYIYCSFVDSKSRVWFATDGKGVSVWDKGQFRSFPSIASATMFGITEDPQGTIWFNAGTEGLFFYKNDSIRPYQDLDLTPIHDISAIASDAEGRLLLVSPNSISLLSPATNQLTTYGPELLLNGIQPDLNAVTQGPNGHFWVGTQKGMLRIIPPDISTQIHPTTRLKAVQVLLSDIGSQDPMTLTHDQNFVSFDYAGLWYHAPDQVQYAYRLQGLSDNWLTTKDRKVSFPKLDPGKYTFELQSASNGNFSYTNLVRYPFRILRPVWQQAWFIVLCLIALGLGITTLVRQREKRLQKTERLEKERIEFQFETLRSQVNPHFLFNSFNTLITIIEEDQETAVDYVEKLSDFFRAMLEYRSRQTISLEEELRLLQDYYYLQQKRYGDNFTLNIDLSPPLNQRQIVPLCLQMLIENALKHNVISQDKPLTVNIFSKEGYLCVKNKVQQKRQPVASTGVGLQNISRRYALLSEHPVRISQEAGQFEVWIPLING